MATGLPSPAGSSPPTSPTGTVTGSNVTPLPLLEGVTGFRDLGGIPTAQGATTRLGVLYRSPCPSELTDSDRDVLAGLQIAVRVDLRSSFELHEAPPVDIAELACAHIPILDARDASRYARKLRSLLRDRRDATAVLSAMVREDGAAFAKVFELLAERSPAVVHCTTGRDRTGLVAAMALRLVGVTDAFIALDYTQSRPVAVPHARDQQGEPILAALADIDNGWGDVEAYLIEHGCPDVALKTFREAFVA